MEFIGTSDERLELHTLLTPVCSIFSQPTSNSLSIIWFQEDDNELTVDGKPYIFGKNEVIFLTEFHRLTAKRKGKFRLLRFNRQFHCVLEHDAQVGCKGLLFFGATELPSLRISELQYEQFEQLWQNLEMEIKYKDDLQISMLQVLLKRFLILSARLYRSQNHTGIPKDEANLIREFNFLVEQHFRYKHRVRDYADMLYKSPKTLSNLFSKSTGKTALAHIKERIILEARRQLRYSDLSIKEISYDLGFVDIQSFSRFFKNHEGQSPSSYRTKAA